MATNGKGVVVSGKILLLHDNHFVIEDGMPCFKGSTFHHLLEGFQGQAHLTSPSLDWDGESDYLNIDGAVIRPRHGYGRAQDFYRSFFSNALRAFGDVYRILKDYDAVVIAGPCCSAPFAHLAAWIRRKSVIGYVIGNNPEVVGRSVEYAGVRKNLAVFAARWEWSAIARITKRHNTIVLGKDLLATLMPDAKALTLGFTSLVREKSIVAKKPFMIEKELSLLTVGRVSQEKGIEWALRAAAELKRRCVPVRYTVVGNGPDLERLRQVSHEIGVASEVEFVGGRTFEETHAYYQRADVFILPSHTEGVAKVLLEAMAARVSVVATAVGGNPWVLGDGERGLLIPYGDSVAIADAVSKLLEDAGMRELLLGHATEYMREHTLEASSRLIMSAVRAEQGRE